MIPQWLVDIRRSVAQITGQDESDVQGHEGEDRVVLSRHVVGALLDTIQALEVKAAGYSPAVESVENGDEMYQRAKRAVADLHEVTSVHVAHGRAGSSLATDVLITIRGKA